MRLSCFRIVRPGIPERVGHLAVDFDSYIKSRLMAGCNVRPIYIMDARTPANPCLLKYWEKYIRVVDGNAARRLQFLLKYKSIVDDLFYDYATAVGRSSPCYAINTAWGERPALLQLHPKHARRGQTVLAEMGIPKDGWFVCVHARGGGYSPVDEHVHSYRNATIDDYIPAMRMIVENGGWCVRVGDATMAPLPKLDHIVDYAVSEFKSDWMDVFLCASCRFFWEAALACF